MNRGYVCNCSKCRKKRAMINNKKICDTKAYKQPTKQHVKRRRKCYTSNYKCSVNCQNNCDCNCRHRINPLYWILALFLI